MGYMVRSSDVEFAQCWGQICAASKRSKNAWIAQLRREGVKAAHPEDGWIDRRMSVLQLVNAEYDDGVRVGDVVALGSSEDYRLVEITGFRRGTFGGEYWLFEPRAVSLKLS